MEMQLVEETRALAATFDLLHHGCTPETVLDAVELDEVLCLYGKPLCDIIEMYRLFRLTGRIRSWERLATLVKRVSLTRVAVRLRLQSTTLREIAEKQISQAFPDWYPDGISRETIRHILIPYGLHIRNFQVTEQTYRLCRVDELCVERALMAHVRRNGGYLPPLSENNGATSRTRTRDQLVASNPAIQSHLNSREKRRKWVRDMKQWAEQVAPKIRSQAHVRQVFIEKMDEWLADPVMSCAFFVHRLKGRRVNWWISALEPDLLGSCARKKLALLLFDPRPGLTEELRLEEARRNWDLAKCTLAKAILKNNPQWVEQPDDNSFWDDDI